jgi:SAM-dependent methyltransferase
VRPPNPPGEMDVATVDSLEFRLMSVNTLVEGVIHALRYREVEPHLRPCETLVDLGCGRSYRFLKRNARLARRCWGLDVEATDGHDGNITLCRADITQPLPLATDCADLVTCLAVIEHIEQPLPLLVECQRILRSGGRLILTTPSERGIHVHEVMRRLRLVRDVDEGEHQDFAMSKARLSDWVRQAGFTLETAYSFELGLNLVVVGMRS